MDLKNHVSIRKYKSDPIPDDVLEDLILCGHRASTSGNLQSWSVVVTSALTFKYIKMLQRSWPKAKAIGSSFHEGPHHNHIV